ncbi:MAG: dUTP diphosphatase [bacterium]|nr:dUTP diphosphatase [bacterium]
MITVNIKRLKENATLPTYSHPGDAGMDLYSAQDVTLQPGETAKVGTGIATAIPSGFVGLVWDRSSMGSKGIKRMGGVIDAGYRGEILVALLNTTTAPYEIKTGDKIAQMLIQSVESATLVEVSDLDDTSRGEGGFGSTGR